MAEARESVAPEPDSDMLTLMEGSSDASASAPAMAETALDDRSGPETARTEVAGSGADAAATPEESYIPPPPVYPEQRGHAEPFAAAALENGGDAGREREREPKRRRPGLLELMAEVAGVGSSERRQEAQSRQRAEPVAGPIASKGDAKPSSPVTASQPTLGGLEPEPRQGPTDAEGEMLDIPAFLRRQAN